MVRKKTLRLVENFEPSNCLMWCVGAEENAKRIGGPEGSHYVTTYGVPRDPPERPGSRSQHNTGLTTDMAR